MYMVLAVAVFTTGMLGNLFIGLVNCSDWVKNQKITFVDFILICLTVSRISFLLTVFIDTTILELNPRFYDSYSLRKCCDIFWVATDQLSTWFATCLSVFYFLKIAYFSHPLFLWLKQRMRRVVVGFFVISLFLLIFYFLLLETLPSILKDIDVITKRNLSLISGRIDSIVVKELIIFDLMYLVPFLVSLVSLFLLFLSLVRHTRNLNLMSTSFEDSRTKVHKKAMKMLLSFLILFIIHVACMQVVRWLFAYFPKNKLLNFGMLTLDIFPLSHSFILILGNSKLQRTGARALQQLKSQMKGPILSLHRFSKVFTRGTA